MLSALSNQDAFVGLHLLGSIVLVGLTGRPESRPLAVLTDSLRRDGGLAYASVDLLITDASSPSPRTTVASLWLDPGRESGREPGREGMPEKPSGDIAGDGGGLTLPPRTEFVGSWALQRLDTLSDRLSMALWTNPPRPLVGEEGLSEAKRPCVGDIVKWSPVCCSSYIDDARSCLRGLVNGTGEPSPAVATEDTLEYLFPKLLPPYTELVLDGERGLSSPSSEAGRVPRSLIASRLSPGSFTFDRLVEASEKEELWALLYAREPSPLSLVCLKKAGSFDPRD